MPVCSSEACIIMSDTKYLFERDQTWGANVAVPRTLRDTLGCDSRGSLHTQDLAAAQAIHPAAVDEFRQKIAQARQRPFDRT